MRPERWDEIQALFDRAADLPPGERRVFVAEIAERDAALGRELDELLSADADAGDFLADSPLPGPSRDIGPEPPIQPRVGPYRILRPLGEGGMSRVHLAVRDDDVYQKTVAVKVIRDGGRSRDLVRRFRTERQILAGLDHPNIAKLLDGGATDEGIPYFVMDYIEGRAIDEYADRAQLNVEERIGLFLEVCNAVEYAHRNLVVHRDLKASNILVTQEGVPKLLDFGIAKLLKPEAFPMAVQRTAVDVRPMTPYYASPEQLRGKTITTATDVYALGVLLYRLLTGRFPYRFEERTARAVEHAVLEQEPQPPSAAVLRPGREGEDAEPAGARGLPSAKRLGRRLDGDLDAILLTALAKEPERRYPSVEQFSADLRRQLAGEPVTATRAGLAYRLGKFVLRNRLAAALAAAIVTLLVGISVVTTVAATRIARERDEAQLERDNAEQVVNFLQGIFRLSDPHQGGGETITAREILDRGAGRVERELAGQPAVQATLMQAIGRVYQNLGLLEPAEALLDRALELRRAEHGSKHPAVAASLSNLGVVYLEKGDYEGARELLEQALAVRRATLGAGHPEVAESLFNLGLLEKESGHFDEAQLLYRQAIEIFRRESLRGELAGALNKLAILLSELGDYERAGALFEEVVEIRRAELGTTHPLTAEALNDLAVFFAIQGRYDRAEPLFRETLGLRRRQLGPRHPMLAESLNNLGRLLKERGEHAAAERLYREALAINREAYGRNHQAVAHFTNNLAVLLEEQEDLDAAEMLYREALDIRRQVLGADHADTGVSLYGLGRILARRGAAAEAENHLQEAVRILERALPAGHWRIGEARSYLGQCLAEQGRLAEAAPLLTSGFEILRRSRGLAHRRTPGALERLLGALEGRASAEELESYRSLRAS